MYIFYYYSYEDGEWDIWIDDEYPIADRDHFCNESYMWVPL